MENFELTYDAFLRALKENTDTGHVFLLGAGASISSGVQSASDCILEWKKNIFITNNPNLAAQHKEFKTNAVQDSIQRWLDNEGSYPPLNSPEEYSFYAAKAFPIDETRKKYFENICRGKEPYTGYKLLCLLAGHGMVRSIFTTNFDGLVERAAHQTGITTISVSLDSSNRIHRAATDNELLYVALHGDYKYGPIKNTGEELDTQHETFVTALKQHLYDKHLIVMGYSGRDKSLMDALSKAYAGNGAGMLFWCGYGHTINPKVQKLLDDLKQAGRKGFFIPTEGFDTSLIHISKTCFESNQEFKDKANKTLQNMNADGFVNSSFTMDLKQSNVLIKSNLLPISLPKEVFQLDVSFNEGEQIWPTIRELINRKNIIAAPLKKMLYALGTHSDIQETFKERLRGAIMRIPVSLTEISTGSVFKNLFLKAIIVNICRLRNLQSDGFKKVWIVSSKRVVSSASINYNLYDAIALNLFFDKNVNAERPFAYLSIQPRFYLESLTGEEVPKAARFEIGKNYHEQLLKFQPNIKFQEQIEKWKAILFPEKSHLQFEYPLQSGTGFKFIISPDTMYVRIMKTEGPKYPLNLPANFNLKTILHTGIQYGEPALDFINKANSQVVRDFHPMRGLCNNRPYDYLLNGNVFDPEINLGIICPATHGHMVINFLERLNQTQSAGTFNPDYLKDYPGFFNAFGIPLNIPTLQSDTFQDCQGPIPSANLLDSAVALADSIKRCIDRLEIINKKLVIVVFIPTAWDTYTTVDEEQEKFDLHDYIKAYAAQKQIATQFLKEDTLSDVLYCQINWWLSLSFYVKSQRTPWILNGLSPDTAFVGIGYSVNHKRTREAVVLGCSHIYNSNGQGLKYRLSRIDDCYIDKKNNPFLSYEDAYKFGILIRESFFNAIGEIPKRVVIHKRTHFKSDEVKGIIDSLKKSGIEQVDLIEINYEDNVRFVSSMIKDGVVQPHFYPLSRGTCFLLNANTALLWTHGIVPSVKEDRRSYFQGGKSIPIPLKVKKHYGQSNISTIATEILGLTKMNWNSFDLYSKLPSTIQTSNEIARIGWLLNRFEGKTYDYRNFM